MNKSDHFDPQKSLEKDVTSKNTESAYFTSKCSLYEGYRHILSSFWEKISAYYSVSLLYCKEI